MCIAFERIGRLDLVPALFDRLLLPEGVRDELFDGAELDDAWTIARLPGVVLVQIRGTSVPRLPGGLHRGEREVIAQSLAHSCTALLDEAPARRAARSHGLRVVGTLGLLLACKHQRLIEEVAPLLELLLTTGFRAKAELVNRVLEQAGEGSR